MGAAPKGTVRIVETVNRKPGNTIAMYVTVIVEDEAGERFFFEASSFLFDLKPLAREKDK